KMGEGCPCDVVSFHAQQCAEKYLKAVLVLCGAEFPKTHDLVRLLRLVPPSVGIVLAPVDVAPLNRYAVEARYPGDWESISPAEAKDALDLARKVRDQVRGLLGAEAIGKRTP
ncbi:MAG: HEPN domain-containing protein, partial [Deferrisomatales bacterium]